MRSAAHKTRHLFAAVAVGLLLAGPPTTAIAIVAGSSSVVSPASLVDPNVPTSPLAGLVSINNGGCSGVLISPTHVLTAAHCGSVTSVNFNQSNPGSSVGGAVNINVIQVKTHPDWTGFDTPNVHDDLRILVLAQEAPVGVPIYAINSTLNLQGTEILLAGYGDSGNQNTGITINGSPYVKRFGFNTLGQYVASDPEDGGVNEVFRMDFDGPTGATNTLGDGGTTGATREVTTAPGDSGSGAFQWTDFNGNGNIDQRELTLVGVNTFVGDASPYNHPAFGSQAGGMAVAAYRNWIIDTAGVAQVGSWADGSGNWATGNWSGKVAKGVDSQATFGAAANPGTLNIRVADLDGTGGVTLGQLTIQRGDSTNFTLRRIRFWTTTGDAQLVVTGPTVGRHAIFSDVEMRNALDVTVAENGRLGFDGQINARKFTLTKLGGGYVDQNAAFINGGFLEIENGGWVTNGTYTGNRIRLIGADPLLALFAGDGTINAFVRIASGRFFAGNYYQPTGSMTVNGDVLMSGGARMTFRFENTGAGGADRLIADGDVTVAGILKLQALAGFTPQLGDEYVIIESLNGSVLGTFGKIRGSLGGPLDFQVVYQADRVLLRIVQDGSALQSIPEPTTALALLTLLALCRRRPHPDARRRGSWSS